MLRKPCLTFAVILLILVAAVAAWGARLDPLLLGLQQAAQERAAGDGGGGLVYERLLGMETDSDGGEPRVGVILHLAPGTAIPAELTAIPGLVVGSQLEQLVTARLPVGQLDRLAGIAGIETIEASRLARPTLDVAVPMANVDDVWSGSPAYTGAGVLVGVIDSGIDWTHDDFQQVTGLTRIKAIWDLYDESGTPPTGFGYGAEYTESQINAGGIGERDFVGHGTHVSGIAAGNGRASSGQYRGVAYEADILFAKAYDDNQGGFPSDRTIDAMNYLAQKAATLNQPLVVNMSLGGHGGAHDGTSAQEQVVDTLTGDRVVFCIAGGNEGEAYIHAEGPGSDAALSFSVPSYTPNGGSSNDYFVVGIWVDGQSSPTVTLSGGGAQLGPVAAGSQGSSVSGAGFLLIDNASQGVDPNNDDKEIIVQVDDRSGTAPAAASWTITVSGGGGTAHAWLYTSTMAAGFPAPAGEDQPYSLGMPGTADEAITVAAYKSRHSWPSQSGTQSYGGSLGAADVGDLAPFSSVGPSRDGRQKPDIASPGAAIISSYSATTDPAAASWQLLPGGEYVVNQGTSMACPFTAGVVALMFEKNGDLSADQIKTHLRDTAITDSFTGATWNARFGAGKVDAAAAVAAVTAALPSGDGDVDGSGLVDVIDLVLVVNYIVDPVGNPLTTEQRARADVFPAADGDGILNASDLVRIVALILGQADPGAPAAVAAPATVAVGDPTYADGHWWVPVTLAGPEIAAGQFALTLPGADWSAAGIAVDQDGPRVAARAVGDQVRVLVYAPDNRLPAGGVTIRLPYTAEDTGAAPRLTGLLVVDPAGYARETSTDSHAGLLAPVRFLQAAPNPLVDRETTISYQLGRAQDVNLTVFDLRGRQVKVLVSGREAEGRREVAWDGRNDAGRMLPAGIYLYRLTTPEQVLTRKIVLSR